MEGTMAGRRMSRTFLGALAAAMLALAARGAELARKGAHAESYEGIRVEYGAVASPGGPLLRTIVTRPARASGQLPALFLAGWLSCDSVEAPDGSRDSTAAMLRGLASGSGMLFYRVDKAGVGDSEGVCAESDFDAELGGYRAAFRQLRSRPDVDPARIFVFGWSNGGGFAPLVPEGSPVAGYVVAGGWVKTWFEHMMEIERRQMTLSGEPPGEVNEGMRRRSAFYDRYLNLAMTPAAIVKERPDLAPVWTDEPERQYGRPATYYRQLQRLNLEAAWAGVEAPVLSIHGEFDFIMSRDDQERIAAIVNARRPGLGRFVEIPGMDHVFGRHGTAAEGMTRMGQGAFARDALETILEWLRARTGS
jgi:pimeloyl-ACP methyl ester carboxylesterase